MIWDKTCTDCNWDAVCTHKKVLWDGKAYQYVTACCRAMNGRTYIPSSFPEEPQDWYLWKTIFKIEGLVIYGRSQLLSPDPEDTELASIDSRPSTSRVPKISSRAEVVQERHTMAKPLVGLKSVYESASETQGSLF